MDLEASDWKDTDSSDMSGISFTLISVIKEYESLGHNIENRPNLEIYPSSLKGIDYPEYFKVEQNASAIISLAASGSYWSQFAYQFAHEYCHYLIGSPMFTKQGGTEESSFWFEESICKLASCFFLEKISLSWKLSTQERFQTFAESHHMYYENHIAKIATIDIPLSQWIHENIESLKEKGVDDNRESYSVIAKCLLPLFLEHPNLWRILPYLKRVDQNTYKDFPHWIKQVVKPEIPDDLSKDFELLENKLIG